MGAAIRRVVLIGLRRAGKTTVGRLIATKAEWALVDTDAVVESSTGRSPADWIRAEGVERFREVERSVVARLAGVFDAVIATGGGVPLSDHNRKALRRDALVVYLRAAPWLLAQRASADPAPSGRPPLIGGTPVEEPFVQFADRDAVYRDFCDVIADASRPPEDIAAAIIDRLGADRQPHSR